MSEPTTVAGDGSRWFDFTGGRYVPRDEPAGFNDGDQPCDFERIGYGYWQAVGNTNGLSYKMYGSYKERGSGGGWIVEFSAGGDWSYFCCASWPDLVELLAKLSPIVMAAALDNHGNGDAFLPVASPDEQRQEEAEWRRHQRELKRRYQTG